LSFLPFVKHSVLKIFNYLFENRNFLKRRSIVLLLITACIIHLLLIFQDVNLLFSEIYFETTSSFRYDFLNAIVPSLVDVKEVLQMIGVPIHLTTPVLTSTYLICLLLIAIDFKPVIFSAIAIYIYSILINSALLHSFGVDTYISLALFINFLIQISRWNLTKIVYPYTIRFIQFQLCIIYFFAGFGKMLGTTWLDGNAMWFISNIYGGGSESVLTELLLNVPYLAVTAIIAMHIGIIFFMKLYSFGIVMIVLNLVAYGHYYKPVINKIINHTKFSKPLIYSHLSTSHTRN